MFKYIVTWVLSILVEEPCPDRFKKDELGRVSNYGCLVFHGRYISTTHTKEFLSMDSAFALYRKACKDSSADVLQLMQQNGRVLSPRIDSARIKK